MEKDKAKTISDEPRKNANFCIHFFHHLSHCLERQAGAFFASGAVKAARALDQASSMIMQASFRIQLCEPTADTDEIDSHFDKKAKRLAQYYANNNNSLAKLLLKLENGIENKDEYLHFYLKSAAKFALFANKVWKRTQSQKPKRPG